MVDRKRRGLLRLSGVAATLGFAGCSRIPIPGDDGMTDGEDATPSGTNTQTADESTPTRTPTATLTPTATPTPPPATDTPTPTPVAQPTQQSGKLAAGDGDQDDFFGSAVAISGDGSTAIIGAERDDDPNGNKAGSAYVFTNSDGTWTQQTKLVPDDGDQDDFFGGSVAISADGTTALIGAERDEDPVSGYRVKDKAGSVYVFTRSDGTWTQQAKLVQSDRDQEEFFGSAVAVSGDGSTAIIGAEGDDDPNGRESGSAHVYTQSDGAWTQQTKLVPDDGDQDDVFGGSVALSDDGTTAVIGAERDEDPVSGYMITEKAGSAYVFTQSNGNWTQQAKLVKPNRDQEEFFGSAVAISGDGSTAVIGTEGDDDPNGDKSGSAYVFIQSDGNWTQQTKLVPDDGDQDAVFGSSVSVSDNGMTAVIGSDSDDDPNGDKSGSAYVFIQSDGNWTQQTKLVPNDGDQDDFFGTAVAVSGTGTTAVVGADRDDDPNGDKSGSAYVFE